MCTKLQNTYRGSLQFIKIFMLHVVAEVTFSGTGGNCCTNCNTVYLHILY